MEDEEEADEEDFGRNNDRPDGFWCRLSAEGCERLSVAAPGTPCSVDDLEPVNDSVTSPDRNDGVEDSSLESSEGGNDVVDCVKRDGEDAREVGSGSWIDSG